MFRTHFEAVAHRQDGSFSLISSTLTGPVWDGNIWVFDSVQDFQDCPNLYMVNTRTAEGMSDVLWLSDQQNLVVASDSGKLEIWNCSPPGKGLEFRGLLKSHDDMALCMCRLGGVAVGGDRVVSGGADGRVIVWDISGTRQLKAYRGHTHMVLSVASNAESADCFVTSSQDGSVRLWDLRLPKPARNITTCSGGIHSSIAWEKDSLVLGNERGKVEILDTRQSSCFLFASYQPHTKSIRRMSFAPWNSDIVASVSDDTDILVHSINANKTVYHSTDHTDFVRGLSWDPVGRGLVTCAWDGKVIYHDVPHTLKEGSSMETESNHCAITGSKNGYVTQSSVESEVEQ